MACRLLVGCYTKGQGPDRTEPLAYFTNHAEQGAYVVDLNPKNGKLSVSCGPVDAGTNPTYATFDPKTSTAYFINENLDKGCVKAFRLDRGVLSNRSFLIPLNSKPVQGVHPCYLSWYPNKRQVLCASYVSGDLTVFNTDSSGSLLDSVTTPLSADGTFPGPVEARQDKAHAHCYVQLGNSAFGLCADLGSDEVFAMRIQKKHLSTGELVSRSKFPAGSGPRHLAVSSDSRWVYASTELSNVIAAIPADPRSGSLGEIHASASLQPAGYTGPPTSASHIELSTCGKFAFVANRLGVDKDGGCANAAGGTISVFKLSLKNPNPEEHFKLVEHKAIGGKVPRSFCVAGKWLIVGAQESSLLISFRIGADGRLSRQHELPIPSPGCVVLAGSSPKATKVKAVKTTMKKMAVMKVMKKRAMKSRRGRLM